MEPVQSSARLTFWEAASIIIGHGIGAGILSVPYLASRNSWWDILWIAAVAYLINLLLHFMIAELSYNNGGAQFIRCFEKELFVGRIGKILTWIAFALLGFSTSSTSAASLPALPPPSLPGWVFRNWPPCSSSTSYPLLSSIWG